MTQLDAHDEVQCRMDADFMCEKLSAEVSEMAFLVTDLFNRKMDIPSSKRAQRVLSYHCLPRISSRALSAASC